MMCKGGMDGRREEGDTMGQQGESGREGGGREGGREGQHWREGKKDSYCVAVLKQGCVCVCLGGGGMSGVVVSLKCVYMCVTKGAPELVPQVLWPLNQC